LAIVLFSWLRRFKTTLCQLALTVAGIYTILYGFSIYWSFQYFAWSIPFWFFAPLSFSVPATILTTAYIYGLYWLVCGNPWLLGRWDFASHPHWPYFLLLFRNLTVLFFFITALIFLITAICAQFTRQKNIA